MMQDTFHESLFSPASDILPQRPSSQLHTAPAATRHTGRATRHDTPSNKHYSSYTTRHDATLDSATLRYTPLHDFLPSNNPLRS